eukprot:gene28385-31642_t
MSTGGYLVFKYNGVYYMIYSNSDSYVTCMGVANMEVLRKLCKDFNGNVDLARQHLRTLFEALVARSKEATFDEEGNPSSNVFRIWKYTHDGFSLAEMNDSRSVVNFVATSAEPPQANPMIEYMWEVDLDAGRFGMGTTGTGTVLTYWSWRALYLMTAADWRQDAETHERYWIDGYAISKTPYDRTYKAILIQATIRRFLALRRALRPPDGYLFHKAKREFEALQHGR